MTTAEESRWRVWGRAGPSSPGESYGEFLHVHPLGRVCLKAAPALSAPLRPGETFNKLLVTRSRATGSEAPRSPNYQHSC